MKKIRNSNSYQTFFSSIICILMGLFIGFIALYLINPNGAFDAITTIILNFMDRSSNVARLRALGNTLAKTAPLIMCALSVCFSYKVGLFNIGVAGQYVIGAGVSLYAAISWNLPWFICILLAAFAGAILGVIIGALKSYRNVNEVLSGIMLNWIVLYLVNMFLGKPNIKDIASPYTKDLLEVNPNALIPSFGLDQLFSNNQMVTISIILSIIFAFIIWILLEKTKLGYELKATGFNSNAAKYAGMKEKRNIILTLAISGALAAIGACFLYLSGYQRWATTSASVPSMGFNGIAATFLGGLHPIGTILSSYFIQHITDGGALIDRMIYPSQISDLITSLIIYLCGFVLFFKNNLKGGKK